ncbi:thiamine biosynthesis protein ThiC [Staphylococcus schleiferi]|uniref:Thiamine biosynthesis protein ThiC n=1 Tax=Staphylococcus schleiferi TaxID=1295 RepID=A0A7Z7VW79_STASC|nr:thiamine biosynthesis protein ThiC [Staphylococcus schleiferi]SUM86602.1 thiamine biosynthesis protein ThiC [Staphylococcus schleiferi]
MKQEQIELKKNFPASQRIYKEGVDPDIHVPFRKNSVI